MVRIIKKDGTLEDFDGKKIAAAVTKSADRVMYKFKDSEINQICDFVINEIDKNGLSDVPIQTMHNLVESALEVVEPKVAKSYKDYRN